MTPRERLAAEQEALVRALVAGGGLPAGFDSVRVGAAARALLRKRAAEVARSWPALAATYGARWPSVFARWAGGGTPSRGAWLDGWHFARAHRAELPRAAAVELAGCEVRWAYRRGAGPRRRPAAVRGMPGGVLVQVLGRVLAVRLPRAQDPR